MRICVECSREFKPSSRHHKCPRCRQWDQLVPCACGRMMKSESRQCVQCRSLAGANNPAWRGGRTRNKAGYVMVLFPEHPRAKSASGYVFEHILVMEDVLGRPLLPTETVHHKNGVKDDNRPENLELWTRPQPSGIRAVDALAWAREIIALYGDVAPTGSSDSSNNASSN